MKPGRIKKTKYLEWVPDQREQSMFNYYYWKRVKNETLDKLKEEGKKDIADLEFYPILFREVLKWMPDGVRCKTNVKEMISMFRANLREQELGRIKKCRRARKSKSKSAKRAKVPTTISFKNVSRTSDSSSHGGV